MTGPMVTEGEQLRRHEGLVRRMARKYGVADEDGYQAGRIGVLLALRTYDPDRAAFSTHAVWLIRKELQREIRVRRAFCMPDKAREAWGRVRDARALEPNAPDPVIAAHAGLSLRQLRVYDAISSMFVASADGPRTHEGRPLLETVPDGSDLEARILDTEENEVMSEAVDSLGPRLSKILRLRFSGLSQRQVAPMVGLSRARVQQLEVAGIDELRRVVMTRMGADGW